MKQRRRVLFIAEAVTLAHLTRPLVLARSLDPAYYEVHFACMDRFPFVFEDETFTRWSIESIPTERFLRSLARGSPLYDYKTLANYVAEDQALIERLNPDLIVGDFRLSLAVSASLAGVPYATITNAYWSPYAHGTYPLPDLPMVRILGVTLSDLIFQAVQPVAFAYHARPLNRLRRENGLAPFHGICETYTHADYTLYADTPGLVPTYNAPANHYYLGPILWSPPSVQPDWWEELPNDSPLVYVTLGSSGRVAQLRGILQVLGEFRVNVIVATAGRMDLASLPELPENVWVSEYLPGEEAAARSVMIICNGGSPTVYQALNAGVPVLGLPTNMDQYLNMRYLQKQGAGIWIRSDIASHEAVRGAIQTLLVDETYRDAAQLLFNELRQYNAAERFQNLLDHWTG
jgi:UDP:flavonoid glycosyltransferase YjiC (YdhE family)